MRFYVARSALQGNLVRQRVAIIGRFSVNDDVSIGEGVVLEPLKDSYDTRSFVYFRARADNGRYVNPRAIFSRGSVEKFIATCPARVNANAVRKVSREREEKRSRRPCHTEIKPVPPRILNTASSVCARSRIRARIKKRAK